MTSQNWVDFLKHPVADKVNKADIGREKPKESRGES